MTDAIKARLSGRNGWFAGTALGMIRKIQDRLETWRSTRRLLAFDDAMLKDIGISRGDVERVVRHGRPPRHGHFPE
jgi:uncharacterized protein YjiS (DUF1127 family)